MMPDASRHRTALLAVGQLLPLPDQPRRYFDEEKLADLAQKIKAKGLLQPLLVRTHPEREGHYQIVVGERRWRASQLAGLDSVPCTIREMDDQTALELALMENLDREDLSPLEEVHATCRILQNRTGLAHPALIEHLYRMRNAVRRGTDEHTVMLSPATATITDFFAGRQKNWESFVVNKLPVLDFAEVLQQAILRGDLEYTKAKALNKIKDPNILQTLLHQAIGEGWGLEQIRHNIKPHLQTKPRPPSFQRYLNAIGKAVNNIPDPVLKARVELLFRDRLEGILKEVQELIPGE